MPLKRLIARSALQEMPEWVKNIISYTFIGWMGLVGFWVMNTYKVSKGIVANLQDQQIEEQLFSALQDAESGQRGFLLSNGGPDYMPQYDIGRRNVESDLAILWAYMQDRPVDAKLTQELQAAVNTKLAELHATMTLAQAGNLDGARQLFLTGKGLKEMDHIRALLDILHARERERMRREEMAFF